MKKYTPSVKNNNQVKDELMQEMKAFLYRIEKASTVKISTRIPLRKFTILWRTLRTVLAELYLRATKI